MRTGTVLLLFVLACGISAHGTPPKTVYKQEALLPAYGPSFNSNDDYLKQILEELKGLRQDVQALKGGTPGATQNDALAVIAARCLACHQDGKAEAKGAGFVLVEKDNALAELSLAEKRRIVRAVKHEGQVKMPPDGKLSDAEVKLLETYFSPKPEDQKK